MTTRKEHLDGVWSIGDFISLLSGQVLGQTFGMLVLQDFHALTPNLLARTVETVEGGGIVVLLLKTMTSLKQLYTMTMVSADASFNRAP